MYVVNVNQFAHKIQTVRQRTQKLQHQVDEKQSQRQDLLATAVEELQTALEELHVAEEELRQQNEELARAYNKVQEERQRYQELFNFAPDGYLVTDVNGKILEANRAAVNLFKVPQKYLIGKVLVNYVPEPERRTFRAKMLSLQEREQLQEWEINLQTREGIKFDASISISSVRDTQGNLVGWRWLVRNITERKQAEEKMRFYEMENLQLEEAARVKSQFLAMVSHELRTPMNTILGFSQLLLRPQQQLASQPRTMVEKIINSGKNLLKLIEDLLDFSKLEAGKLQLRPEEFNLDELVKTTTEELRCLAEQKNLTLAVHMEMENPIVINDSDRLRQVLVNLVANAIKFTDIGGVFVEVQQNQDRVTLMVKDTGIGIPEADLKYIFNEFWQVNQSSTRKHGGTGLGLAITDKLVRLMNGTISVQSKPGDGSTFRVQLPRTMNNYQ